MKQLVLKVAKIVGRNISFTQSRNHAAMTENIFIFAPDVYRST